MRESGGSPPALPAPPPPPRGVCFPGSTNKEAGPTSKAGRECIAAAIAAVDTGKEQECCYKERNWRFGYVKHFEQLVRTSCKSPAAATKTAQAGLDWAYDNFVFVANDVCPRLSARR